MSDDTDNGGDVEQFASILNGLAEALSADSIVVKLQNGREITGPIVGFNFKRKEKKGDITWVGTVRVQTDSGALEIDCEMIEEVSSS